MVIHAVYVCEARGGVHDDKVDERHGAFHQHVSFLAFLSLAPSLSTGCCTCHSSLPLCPLLAVGASCLPSHAKECAPRTVLMSSASHLQVLLPTHSSQYENPTPGGDSNMRRLDIRVQPYGLYESVGVPLRFIESLLKTSWPSSSWKDTGKDRDSATGRDRDKPGK